MQNYEYFLIWATKNFLEKLLLSSHTILFYVFNFWSKILKLACVLVSRLNSIHLYLKLLIQLFLIASYALVILRWHMKYFIAKNVDLVVMDCFQCCFLRYLSMKRVGWVKGVGYYIRTEFSEKSSLKTKKWSSKIQK